jgi:hypothetical protein
MKKRVLLYPDWSATDRFFSSSSALALTWTQSPCCEGPDRQCRLDPYQAKYLCCVILEYAELWVCNILELVVIPFH